MPCCGTSARRDEESPALNAIHTFDINVYGGIINVHTVNYCLCPAISDNALYLQTHTMTTVASGAPPTEA